MDFYTNIAATVKSLIEKYGYELVVSQPINAGSKFDPEITYVETYSKGVVSRFNHTEVDGTSILSTDKLILMASTVEPIVGDRIVDGLSAFTVINTVVISPAGIDVLYKVQVRI